MPIVRDAARLVLTLVLILSGSAAATADDAASFYRGKQITLLIGFSPGGAYDLYARALARTMPRHIPGNPVFVARNMPGAGSLLAANYLANVSPRDGSEFGTISRDMLTASLFGKDNTRFDVTTLNWLGNPESAEEFCGAWAGTGFERARDLFEKPFIVGATNGDSSTVAVPLALNHLVGTRLRLINGYDGSAAMEIALERGELQGRCGWSWSGLHTAHGDWLDSGKVKIIMSLGLTRSPRWPDIPTASELAPNDDNRQALDLILSQDLVARPYAAPPGVPPDRVALLRKAFDETMADPAFKADLDRQGLLLEPMTGAEIERVVQRLNAMPKKIVDLAIAATRRTQADDLAAAPK